MAAFLALGATKQWRVPSGALLGKQSGRTMANIKKACKQAESDANDLFNTWLDAR